jgi:hypothetical protein
MFDPNDEIIGLFVSIATDSSIEMASKYFSSPISRVSKSLPPFKKLLPKFAQRLLYNHQDFAQNLEFIDRFSRRLMSKSDQLLLFMAV